MSSQQRRTLELFTALRLLQPSWAGTLLLGIGLNEAGRALALASLAAGAAALFLEADAANLRTAAREGCTTFTVNTLDEALRALKNEIRQGRAITVALSGDPTAALREIVERGVQPGYLAPCYPLVQNSIGILEACGTRILSGFGLQGSPQAIALDERVTDASAGWQIAEDDAESLMQRRAQDASMIEATTGDVTIAIITRQWLRMVPTLFPRALDRALWTTASLI